MYLVLLTVPLSLLVLLIIAHLFVPRGMGEPGTGYLKWRSKQLKKEQRRLHPMPYQW